jgi:hypothetical protein
MTETDAIVCIIVGCVAIILALTVKQFYRYSRNPFGGDQPESKIPRWEGRLIFLIVGAGFTLVGVSFFFR